MSGACASLCMSSVSVASRRKGRASQSAVRFTRSSTRLRNETFPSPVLEPESGPPVEAALRMAIIAAEPRMVEATQLLRHQPSSRPTGKRRRHYEESDRNDAADGHASPQHEVPQQKGADRDLPSSRYDEGTAGDEPNGHDAECPQSRKRTRNGERTRVRGLCTAPGCL